MSKGGEECHAFELGARGRSCAVRVRVGSRGRDRAADVCVARVKVTSGARLRAFSTRGTQNDTWAIFSKISPSRGFFDGWRRTPNLRRRGAKGAEPSRAFHSRGAPPGCHSRSRRAARTSPGRGWSPGRALGAVSRAPRPRMGRRRQSRRRRLEASRGTETTCRVGTGRASWTAAGGRRRVTTSDTCPPTARTGPTPTRLSPSAS